MYGLLLLVTDQELMVAQIVKGILLVALLAGILINIRSAIRATDPKRRIWRFLLSSLLLALAVSVIRWLQIDGSILKSQQYVPGRTTGICDLFGRGKGVSFEYELDGVKYFGCSTYHPLRLDSIKVPGGYYEVRYSDKYPSRGRIDFKKNVR